MAEPTQDEIAAAAKAAAKKDPLAGFVAGGRHMGHVEPREAPTPDPVHNSLGAKRVVDALKAARERGERIAK